MAKRQKRSSNCLWHSSANDAAAPKLIKALDPVKALTVLTPDSYDQPQLHVGSVTITTLADVVNSNCSAAISFPANETHDTFLILNGTLWLSLSAESFTSFGLEGKKNGSRYLCIYDLHNPGKRRDRLDWVLANKITAKHKFSIFASGMQPTSMPSATSRPLNIVIPSLIPPIENEYGEFDEWANSLIEWVGLSVLSPALLSRNNGGIDPAICDYRHPEGEGLCPVSVTHFAPEGGLRAEDVDAIWNNVRGQRWAVMHIQGFADSPVTWTRDVPHEIGKEVGYMLIQNGQGTTGYFKYL